MRRSESTRCASALSTLSSKRFSVCPTIPTSLSGSVSSCRTRTLIRCSSPVSGIAATSAAVAATRRSGRSVEPTTHTVSPAVITRAAAISRLVVMYLRAMISVGELHRHPDDQQVGSVDAAVDAVGAEAAEPDGAGRRVGPGLRFDRADDIGRGGFWLVLGENRRADNGAVVHHGDQVARRLSGELQHRLRDRRSAAVRRSVFSVLVSGVRVAQCVKGFRDIGVAYRGDVAAQAEHRDHADASPVPP